MSDTWWMTVERWTGDFRRQQQFQKNALRKTGSELLVGTFDLQRDTTYSNDLETVWSGTLTGQVVHHNIVWPQSPSNDAFAQRGSGTFTLPVRLVIDDSGYGLEFGDHENAPAYEDPGSAEVTGPCVQKRGDADSVTYGRWQVGVDFIWGYPLTRLPLERGQGQVLGRVVEVELEPDAEKHREHWLLGSADNDFPRPYDEDGNLYPPFDGAKRPPFASELSQGAGHTGTAPPDGPPPPPPGPPPSPTPPPRQSMQAFSASGWQPQAEPREIYILDSEDATVFHFLPNCPALNNGLNGYLTETVEGNWEIVDVEAELNKPACGTCLRIARAAGGRSGGVHSVETNQIPAEGYWWESPTFLVELFPDRIVRTTPANFFFPERVLTIPADDLMDVQREGQTDFWSMLSVPKVVIYGTSDHFEIPFQNTTDRDDAHALFRLLLPPEETT